MSNKKDHIEQLISEARRVTMTPQDREAQRRSFAYGNAKIENDDVTREGIDRAADTIAELKPDAT